MVNPLRLLLLFLCGLPILAVFIWHSGQRIDAELGWIEAKISDPRYATALVDGCYDFMGVDPFASPNAEQATDILECLRWELVEMARMEGVVLSENVLDTLLDALREQIWPT